MTKQTLKLLPALLSLLTQLVGNPPSLQVFAQSLVVVGYCAEPLVAAESKEGIHMVGDHWFGEGRSTASSPSEVLEPLKQGRYLRALMFPADTGC